MAPLDSARRSESSASSDGGGSPPAGISFIARKDDGGGPARPPTAPGPPHGVVASRNLAGTSSAGEPSGEHRATDDGGGGGGGEGSGSGGSSRPGRQGKHASRYKKLTPSEVSECAPHEILDGIGLSLQRLGCVARCLRVRASLCGARQMCGACVRKLATRHSLKTGRRVCVRARVAVHFSNLACVL